MRGFEKITLDIHKKHACFPAKRLFKRHCFFRFYLQACLLLGNTPIRLVVSLCYGVFKLLHREIKIKFMSTEEAKQLIEELEKLRRQTRRFRLLTFIALLVIVITGVSAIIESVYSLTLAGPRQTEFIGSLSVDLKSNLLPTVEKIAGRSVEALKPAIEKELKEINGRAPEVADVALRELDQMGGELTVQAGKVLDQTITGTLQKREGKLRQMYPDVYDKQIDTLLNNLALEAQDQLAQSGENIFNPHLNSIQSILTNLDKIQKTEPAAASNNVDSWQVAYMFMDVFVHEFKGLGPPEPANAKAAGQKVVQPKKTKEITK